jgi:hypothetical protein
LLAPAILALTSSHAVASKPYTFVPLEVGPGGSSATAWLMNEAGLIVGSTAGQPARWDPGSTAPTLLGNLRAGLTTSPTAVDSLGTIYGRWADHSYTDERPVRWNPGSAIPVELGVLGTDSNGKTRAGATGVSASGLALGWAIDFRAGSFGGDRAVAWTAGSTTPTIVHPNLPHSARPVAMNSSGTLVEQVAMSIYWKPRRWNAQTEPEGTYLKTLDDLDFSAWYRQSINTYAKAINEAGVVVGQSTKSTWRGNQLVSAVPMGVKWMPGSDTPIRLDSFYGASDINDAGAIVGGTNGGRGAVLYPGASTATDLSTLADVPSQWTISEAVQINNKGQILGQARYDPDGPGPAVAVLRPVLLDPKPLLADANRDMKVDFIDFQILEVNFGSEFLGLSPATARARGDFNTDGEVDSLDFGLLRDQFGWWIPAVPSSETAVSVVPEPGALFAACAAVTLMARRVRR